MNSPIFLTGPGRSGTTICNNLISKHPQLVSLNSWYAKTRIPLMNSIGERIRRNENLEKKFGTWKGFPRPTEPLAIWRESFTNFWEFINGKTDVVIEAEIDDFRYRLNKIMTHELRSKILLTKMTGPPFNSFLRRIYPNAKIVWIDRDPRAVVMSHVKRGWLGISKKGIKNLQKKDKIRLACNRYNQFHKLRINENFEYILYYENLIENPLSELRRCVESLGLDWSLSFKISIKQTNLYSNKNDQYSLSRAENDLLIDLLAEPLQFRQLV